jgi:uncharacterized iron-regulated membrane protein
MSFIKPKRMTMMKIHGYTSVFFLVLLFIYALTGTLDLFDIEGSRSSHSEVVDLDKWPKSEKEALLVMPTILVQIGEEELPSHYSDRRGHEWSDLTKSISLSKKKGSKDIIEVTVKEPGFMRQMLMIHKGDGGPIFTVLGVALGIYLLLMIITGVWLTFKTRPMHSGSIISAVAGVLVVVLAYGISVF